MCSREIVVFKGKAYELIIRKVLRHGVFRVTYLSCKFKQSLKVAFFIMCLFMTLYFIFPPYHRNLVLHVFDNWCFPFSISASTSNMAKIEEMERLLREAQAEKHRLLEHRVMCQT